MEDLSTKPIGVIFFSVETKMENVKSFEIE